MFLFTLSPEQALNDYCNQLRDEVNAMHKKHIAALINYRDDLHMRIDQYERECASHIENQKNWMKKNKTAINETKKTISEWSVNLR